MQEAFADDGSPLDTASTGRIEGFLDELEWYARALKRAREQDSDRERSECEAQHLVAPTS